MDTEKISSYLDKASEILRRFHSALTGEIRRFHISPPNDEKQKTLRSFYLEDIVNVRKRLKGIRRIIKAEFRRTGDETLLNESIICKNTIASLEDLAASFGNKKEFNRLETSIATNLNKIQAIIRRERIRLQREMAA